MIVGPNGGWIERGMIDSIAAAATIVDAVGGGDGDGGGISGHGHGSWRWLDKKNIGWRAGV